MRESSPVTTFVKNSFPHSAQVRAKPSRNNKRQTRENKSTNNERLGKEHSKKHPGNIKLYKVWKIYYFIDKIMTWGGGGTLNFSKFIITCGSNFLSIRNLGFCNTIQLLLKTHPNRQTLLFPYKQSQNISYLLFNTFLKISICNYVIILLLVY